MYRSILRLNDGWIVILTCLTRVANILVSLQIALPSPGSAFVVGKGDGQLIASLLQIIVHENPASTLQLQHLCTGPWIGDLGIDHGSPGFTAVARFTVMKSFRRRSIVPHVGNQGAVASQRQRRLDVTYADDWSACVPAFPPVIGVCDQRKTETVRIERHQYPPVDDNRMSSGHPAESTEQLIACVFP